MIHVNNHIFTSKYVSKSINFNKSQGYFVFYSSGSKGLYIFIVGPGRPVGWCRVGMVWSALASVGILNLPKPWRVLSPSFQNEGILLLFQP